MAALLGITMARVYINLWWPIAKSREVRERTGLLRQGGMRFFFGFIVEQALGKKLFH